MEEETQMNQDAPMERNLDPNEAAATLAFMTNLSEQGMMAQQMPVESPESQQGGISTEKTMNTQDEDMEGKFDDFRQEVKDTIKTEINQIKEMIKETLLDDEEKNDEEQKES